MESEAGTLTIQKEVFFIRNLLKVKANDFKF